jgi:hypothetical protein
MYPQTPLVGASVVTVLQVPATLTYVAMAYTYFSQTSPSLPPVGVPVDVKMFLTTPELVLAVVTAPLVTLTAPIALGKTGSNPP